MRTIGRRRILSLDEVPAFMEKRLREPTPPEVLEHRRRVSARMDQLREEILNDNGPIKDDVKDMLRRERGEGPIG